MENVPCRRSISTYFHTYYAFFPTWYSNEMSQPYKQYLDSGGISVTGEIKYRLSEEWDSIPEQDRFDHRAVWHVSSDKILKDIRNC